MTSLLQWWQTHLRVIDRILVIVFVVWIMVLATVVICRQPVPKILDEGSDVARKIDEIHRWSAESLAPSK